MGGVIILNKSIKKRRSIITTLTLLSLIFSIGNPILSVQTEIEEGIIHSSHSFSLSTELVRVHTYEVRTIDNESISLIHYPGDKTPIILIHGGGCNHRIFDWDAEHSLAQYLKDQGWDVWLLDLRTHDGDGDFFFRLTSDTERINRYWDFDNTYLKIDVVTAVDFVKKQTKNDKIILSGHSLGGYLAYAYAMIIGEENLSAIITTGSCPYANPPLFQPSFFQMRQYGYYLGRYAFVNPIGKSKTHASFISRIRNYILYRPTANPVFYYNTTLPSIQKQIGFYADDEPAGVYVDIYFGKNPYRNMGHWVDPQTLYDYSNNLKKITVPILFIAGEKDTQDPADGIYRAYQKVSSKEKMFYSFPNHSHLDLLLGEYSHELVFPIINNWMENHVQLTDLTNECYRE